MSEEPYSRTMARAKSVAGAPTFLPETWPFTILTTEFPGSVRSCRTTSVADPSAAPRKSTNGMSSAILLFMLNPLGA